MSRSVTGRPMWWIRAGCNQPPSRGAGVGCNSSTTGRCACEPMRWMLFQTVPVPTRKRREKVLPRDGQDSSARARGSRTFGAGGKSSPRETGDCSARDEREPATGDGRLQGTVDAFAEIDPPARQRRIVRGCSAMLTGTGSESGWCSHSSSSSRASWSTHSSAPAGLWMTAFSWPRLPSSGSLSS